MRRMYSAIMHLMYHRFFSREDIPQTLAAPRNYRKCDLSITTFGQRPRQTAALVLGGPKTKHTMCDTDYQEICTNEFRNVPSNAIKKATILFAKCCCSRLKLQLQSYKTQPNRRVLQTSPLHELIHHLKQLTTPYFLRLNKISVIFISPKVHAPYMQAFKVKQKLFSKEIIAQILNSNSAKIRFYKLQIGEAAQTRGLTTRSQQGA